MGLAVDGFELLDEADVGPAFAHVRGAGVAQ